MAECWCGIANVHCAARGTQVTSGMEREELTSHCCVCAAAFLRRLCLVINGA